MQKIAAPSIASNSAACWINQKSDSDKEGRNRVMIISIPTSVGTINLCLSPQTIKVLACIVGVGMILAGYTVMQLISFVMSASLEQFIRLILVAILVVSILITRTLLAWKAGMK